MVHGVMTSNARRAARACDGMITPDVQGLKALELGAQLP